MKRIYRAMLWSTLWSLAVGVGAALAEESTALPGAPPSAAVVPAGKPSSRRVVEEAATLAGGLSVELNKAFHREGEILVVSVDVPREGYLNVLSVNADDVPTVLFPNQHYRDNRVAAGRFTLPSASMKFDLTAAQPYGATLVAAFLSKEPVDFYASGVGDRDGEGAMQESFARLSAASRSQLRQLAARSFAVTPRAAPLLGGLAYGAVCPPSAACNAASVAGPPPGVVLEDKLTPGILLGPGDAVLVPRGVQPRPLYDKGLRLTKLSEGFVAGLYNNSEHYCSIAYGHLVRKARCDGNARFERGVSEAQGESLLLQDMRAAQLAVMSLVTTALSDGQYAALSDFTYSVGADKLQKSTLLKAVNAGEHHRVPSQLRRWSMLNGKELARLKTRREREIQLYFEGRPVPAAAPVDDEDLTPIDIRVGE